MILALAILSAAAGVFGTVVYIAAIALHNRAAARGVPQGQCVDTTVIVAARNEERRLPALIDHLLAQSYPRDLFRVIIADDRSTDGTDEIARAAAAQGLDIEVLRIDAVPPNISPKKNALDTAIRSAGTDILLFTDADCRPEPDWIRDMAAHFRNAEVVIGVSHVVSRHAFVRQWVWYESARTAMLSCAAAEAGRPYMAVGRNWGYTKSLYEASGGLAPLFPIMSGDDDLLLQRFVRHGARVAVCAGAGSHCPSDGPEDVHALLRQKIRHFSASRGYGPKTKAMLAALHAAQFISLFAGPCALLALGVPALPVLLCVFLKLAVDAQCVIEAMPSPPSDIDRFAGIAMEWIYTGVSAALGLVSQWTRPEW
jgi:hypothetical protein